MRTSIDRVETVHKFVEEVFGDALHVKRVLSLAFGALGVLTSASLAVAMIGHGLAQARGKADKHAVKQVDRLLSNPGVDVWKLFEAWVDRLVGKREKIVVAMDWTDFVPRQARDEGRQPDDAGFASGHRSRARHAADLAQRRQGRVEEQAQ
jgi:hypothetical protein